MIVIVRTRRRGSAPESKREAAPGTENGAVDCDTSPEDSMVKTVVRVRRAWAVESVDQNAAVVAVAVAAVAVAVALVVPT